MATTKTLAPTNQTITIAAFQGEKPDQRQIADAEGKLADAINALYTSSSVNCEQYCSSSETEVTTRLFCYGKTRTLSFMGTTRTHAEDEIVMTLPSEHRPVGQVLVFGNGSIKGTPVVMRFNGGNGQVAIFLINGATSSGRLYFTMSWVVA